MDPHAIELHPSSRHRGRRCVLWVRRRCGPLFVSLLIACGVVVVAFPEVVFMDGSLSPEGLFPVVNQAAHPKDVHFYPTLSPHEPQDGERDIGARLWQLVPATKFMHRAIYEGESPYWNPYSGSGDLGPETLVDMKFSPFVLQVALLGASSRAFTLTALAFVVAALFCLQQFFTCILGTGRLAATAACLVFLLNGFAVSDFKSQVGAPYVLFPIVLYALAAYHRARSPSRLLVAVAAYAALLLTTFVPVALLMLVLIHAIVVALDRSWRSAGGSRTTLRFLARDAVVPALAVLVTAFFWIPALEALRRGGGDLEQYAHRSLQTKAKIDTLGLLSPWLVGTKRWTMYVGVTPLLLIAMALPRAIGRYRTLLWLASGLAFIALLEHLGVPYAKALGDAPGLRIVRQDYWAALAAGALVVGVGVAVHTLCTRGLSLLGAFAGGTCVLLVLGGGWLYSEVAPKRRFAASAVLPPMLLVLVLLGLVALARYQDLARRSLIVGTAVALIAVELLSYQNHVRSRDFDVERHTPGYVAFLRRNIGDDRVLNAGRLAINPEWGTVLRIPQVETILTTQIPEYRNFYRRWIDASSGNRPLFLYTHERSAPFNAQRPALDLLSVRYLVVDHTMVPYNAKVSAEFPLAFDDAKAKVKVYENVTRFPRAYLSPTLMAREPDGPWTGLWSQQVAVTDDAALLRSAKRARVSHRPSFVDPHAGTARIVSYRNDRVEIDVHAAMPAILVLTDTFHDNWHVSVDHRQVRTGRVNEVVRGVVVPQGHSIVVFSYRSRSRELGTAISLATIAVMLIVCSVWAFRRGTLLFVRHRDLVGAR